MDPFEITHFYKVQFWDIRVNSFEHFLITLNFGIIDSLSPQESHFLNLRLVGVTLGGMEKGEMKLGQYKRKWGRGLFGWEERVEGFLWVLGVFSLDPPNFYLSNFKNQKRENKIGEELLKKTLGKFPNTT